MHQFNRLPPQHGPGRPDVDIVAICQNPMHQFSEPKSHRRALWRANV
jgi:hypothetical protein